MNKKTLIAKCSNCGKEEFFETENMTSDNAIFRVVFGFNVETYLDLFRTKMIENKVRTGVCTQCLDKITEILGQSVWRENCSFENVHPKDLFNLLKRNYRAEAIKFIFAISPGEPSNYNVFYITKKQKEQIEEILMSSSVKNELEDYKALF